MENTILTQIIKKVILAEQDGFNPVPIRDTSKVQLNPKVTKKVDKKVDKKVNKKVDPKKPDPKKTAKVTAVSDVLLSPTTYKNPHLIFSKSTDGIWRYEYYDKASKTVKSGVLSDPKVKAQLDAGKYVPWTGKYSNLAGKKSKKDWLALMDMRDPAFPEKSQDPIAGGPVSLVLSMIATYGLQLLGAAALFWFRKKLIIAPIKFIGSAMGIGGEAAQVRQIMALHGVNAAELAQLEKIIADSLRKGEITSSQAKKLRKAFNNPFFRSPVSKIEFTNAYNKMVKGEMTMDEFIQLMPKVYRENGSLTRVLFEYENQLNSMYPARKAAWNIAADKYAQRNSQFAARHRSEIDQVFDKLGVRKDNPLRSMWSGETNSYDLAAKSQASKMDAASKMAMNAAKISKGVDEAIVAARYDANSWKMFHLTKMAKTEFTKLNPYTLMQFERALGSKTMTGRDIPNFLKELSVLKTEKDAIDAVKQFAIAKQWSYAKDSATMEEFMLHVLKYFRK